MNGVHEDVVPAVRTTSANMRPQWSDHPENPVNWNKSRKWLVTAVVSWLCFSAGINATAILTPAATIGQQFGFNDEDFPTSYWTVTAWTMGGAAGPMVGLPLLEEFGMRKGYLISYIGFMIFLIPQAVAQNFTTLIVTRVFAGFFASILMNGAASVIPDLFNDEIERALPLTLFILVYEAGYTLGPVYAACFPAEQWRWIFYTHLIVFGAFLPVLWFTLQETRGHVVRAQLSTTSTQDCLDDREAYAADESIEKASTQADERPHLLSLFYAAIVRPIELLFTQPVVAALTLWSAFTTALVFISTESIEQIFAENFNFSDRSVGVVQLSLFVGEVVGFIACLPQNSYYIHSARWNKETPGQPVPEARLMLSIPASFIGLAGGLFWYAWASSPGLSWVLPALGLGLIGFGIVIIVNTAVVYLTDAYTSFAGSAVAALAMGENVLAAWIPLSTPRMYRVLGPHWASSLLAFVALALSFVPVVLTIYGRQIRMKSNLMEGK